MDFSKYLENNSYTTTNSVIFYKLYYLQKTLRGK